MHLREKIRSVGGHRGRATAGSLTIVEARRASEIQPVSLPDVLHGAKRMLIFTPSLRLNELNSLAHESEL